MRFLLLGSIVITWVLAGCIEAAEDAAELGEELLAEQDAYVKPVTVMWKGEVPASAAEIPTHVRPTEDALWPVFKEGFLFDVEELPRVFQVALEWKGTQPGEFMIMLHSHKAHGSNMYVEHITKMDAQNPKCLQVPAEDLMTGEWQVMVHSQGAVGATFELAVTLVGGKGVIVPDDRHGHWLQDGVFEVEEHKILPCESLSSQG